MSVLFNVYLPIENLTLPRPHTDISCSFTYSSGFSFVLYTGETMAGSFGTDKKVGLHTKQKILQKAVQVNIQFCGGISQAKLFSSILREERERMLSK